LKNILKVWFLKADACIVHPKLFTGSNFFINNRLNIDCNGAFVRCKFNQIDDNIGERFFSDALAVKIVHKIIFTLCLMQRLTSAGFIAAAILNSNLGAEIGGKSWAGIP
ncbi:MAG: hypothetical protein QGD96_11090, partial [Anaerolineae bacterium]|nr:hypothetical protein [Anaerolineae bacterium]